MAADSRGAASMCAEPRHMSMLRSYTPADALTIGNAACGTIAIFLCLDYLASGNREFLWTAFVLLPLALVCDVLDGYVARMDKARQSMLGADLDSLADVISFGVAPAVLGFTLGLRGGWDMLILTYFVICGVSRLARFNVDRRRTDRRRHWKGAVLRRHADPHEHRHCPAAGDRVDAGTRRRASVVRGLPDRAGAPPSASPRLRREWQRHD